MTDHEIVQHLRDGRRTRAFTRLYRYYPKVRALIRQHGGSSDDAADVFQEALIILCRKASAPDFTLTASLDTYLYSVCRFVWSTELRRRTRSTGMQLDPAVPDVEESVEQESKYQLAEKAFANLGEKCREILRLFYIVRQSMEEIAQTLGYATEQSARNQKYKCLENTREAYKQLIDQQGRAAL